MIKVTNQEEFEKCLSMLDSVDVECRLLGWELLSGCTDLHKNTKLLGINTLGILIRDLLTVSNEFIWAYGNLNILRISYSNLIREFTIKSKIFLPYNNYIKLR